MHKLLSYNEPVSMFLLDHNSNSTELFFNSNHEHCENFVFHKYDLKNKSVIITLEPCISCSFLLLQCKLNFICFGAFNSNYGGLGGSINLSSKYNLHNITICGGILEHKSSLAIKQFFLSKR